MIYITGDLHGFVDIAKLHKRDWPEGQKLTKNDYLIICGDFGCLWYNNGKDDILLEWLNNQPWTTLFIEGNHENYDLLRNYDKYPIEDWKNGKIQKIMPYVYHLMRGEIYNIDDYKIFTYGGAYSTDRYKRREGISWWKHELPTKEEQQYAIDNLKKHNNIVDIILTHDIPRTMRRDFWFLPSRRLDGSVELIYGEEFVNSRDMFNYIEEYIDFKCWFAGHMHEEARTTRNNKQFILVYEDILQLTKNEEQIEVI